MRGGSDELAMKTYLQTIKNQGTDSLALSSQ
jgi:hypothetical protein